jgi:hypothetical protein
MQPFFRAELRFMRHRSNAVALRPGMPDNTTSNF